jgi:hypothetical protein
MVKVFCETIKGFLHDKFSQFFSYSASNRAGSQQAASIFPVWKHQEPHPCIFASGFPFEQTRCCDAKSTQPGKTKNAHKINSDRIA